MGVTDNWQCGSYIPGVSVSSNPWLSNPANFAFFMNTSRAVAQGQYGMTGPDDPRGTVGGPLALELINQFTIHARPHSTNPRLQLYSAHDTTLTALWSALGLLDPQSMMNTPTFAQSATFELRPPAAPGPAGINSDEYLVTIKVGAPVWNPDGSWSYGYHAIPVPCNGDTEVYACPLVNFTAAINNQIVPGGGCIRTDRFLLAGCGNYSATTAEFQSSLGPDQVCALYRNWCPLTVCDVGQILNSGLDVSLSFARSSLLLFSVTCTDFDCCLW